ncbi:protein MTSS 2-like [Rhinatrema bivittatum]|uniref:protein MTSS 2-like n=1 Tax=Rhinatrema bivittatum TaxID=194408 RepID=UPI00112AA3EC|nr:protein MTSS 2-like [Rhinatrema bivittatum]
MDAGLEKECSALGGLFQTIVNDMKSSYPTWEDFISKAIKLQTQLRTTAVVTGSFLDAFQKIADMAMNTRGATKEIGSALTRMCLRHRNIESRLKQLTLALTDNLINPLDVKIEEWKKIANQLDKDHTKEYKKARAELKKKSSDTLKLQKKVKKGKDDVRMQLDCALQDVTDKYALLEEMEKKAVTRALTEERGRFCTFVSLLRPVLDEEIGMLGEITHLQTILEDLTNMTAEPNILPPTSEQVIHDLKSSDYNFTYHTPPSSPSSTLSRKASINSNYTHGSIRHVPSMDSICSSVEGLHLTSTSSLIPDGVYQDQNAVGFPNLATGGENNNIMHSQSADGHWSVTSYTVTKPNQDHLTLALNQELALNPEFGTDLQHSSRDSLHCSSGYSTQTTTPSCSEDTIPAHVADYDYISLHEEQEETDQLDFDKSSTIPRNSDISQNYRRLFKRPASTVSLLTDPDPIIRSPYVATIKRKPSGKPPIRRGTISSIPVPIKTPVVPNYFSHSSGIFGGRTNSEEFVNIQDARSDLSQMKPCLYSSSQSLSAIHTPYCAVMPNQPYSYYRNMYQSNPSPQTVITSNNLNISTASSVVDHRSEHQTTNPYDLQRVDGIESCLGPYGLQTSTLTPTEDNMLKMIRRGVSLRKTISNDRSAPKI